MDAWSIDAARELYSIRHWSAGYFDVDEKGRLVGLPRGAGGASVPLPEVVERAAEAGLSTPLLVRFEDILAHRAKSLCDAFSRAMEIEDYRGGYTAVYPVKVNQQRSVVDAIIGGADGSVGLEAGSKPELMAVMAWSPDGGVVICNGYKDRDYIRLALIGRQLGLRTFLVVEKLSELELILEESRALGVRPALGVRMRLASLGRGNWQNTGGEKAKFGLSAGQLLEAVDTLRKRDMGDCLQLLHFHMGSQISNVRDIQRGMREAARFYAELRDLGLDVRYMDVGGGLGVDYEGTRSRSFCSMNYGLDQYAGTVVRTLREACDERELPHPAVITEAGRAMTAHHAVLVTNVSAVETTPELTVVEAPAETDHQVLHDLWDIHQALDERAPLECYQDALQFLAEAQSMYIHGLLDLGERARAEALSYAICRGAQQRLSPDNRAHREAADELRERLADKYFCNFSVFQSVPDVWAIEQVFPIVPLTRLDEKPERRAVIEDLTCDSDGRIDHYVDRDAVETTLPLHGLRKNEPYLLGLFLVGAYQETLGDIHNLFGDTHSVDVRLEGDGWVLERPRRGDSAGALLDYVGYGPDELMARYRARIEAADLTRADGERLLATLKAGLEGYTYLNV